MIDDFHHGSAHIINPGGATTAYQPLAPSATSPRARCINLTAFVEPNSRQNVTLDVGFGQGLGLGSGPRVRHRLEVLYGFDLAGALAPLALDLRTVQGFRLRFAQSSHPLNVNVLLWRESHVADSLGVGAPASDTPFTVEFPLQGFSQNTPPGDAAPTIVTLGFVIQGGAAHSGHDYIVSEFSAY